MILVSACLAGIKCKYDGGDNKCDKVVELVKKGLAIPVCPEQLGGLSTPRNPAEIVGDQVISNRKIDVTENFQKGAEETLKIAQMIGCKKAILKQCSPSCGFGEIYDGSFSGIIKSGNGITAELLAENGIEIITEEEL
ncbi:MAG: DUF523 domain-containing protein [Candidatus Cloacimonetes bacterium]|nr:DUF523 domain-containing protein [Candidatus Cloacimonadota bacterium]MCF7813776.1 DUF523 domain-containing protein [Candidatus Cloacimonadota bacterium]MCF7868352.1 DUF523 domain-containing protein [Candidatus Cloacimonadota bacterium]MCF7883826.1 DUF523 domain-containing protein [Candidatus Cloacimonadota bacterium]